MNYKLPLDISRLFSDSGGKLEQCSELESIDQFLAAILSTRIGEHGFNHLFGSRLWEMDFENVESKSVWEEKFIEYATEAIIEHEKRLTNIEVQINVKDVLREDNVIQGFSVRKQVDIIIIGTVVSTNRKHGFKHVFYMGPLTSSE
jgi:phage baseplate assembly protein W